MLHTNPSLNGHTNGSGGDHEQEASVHPGLEAPLGEWSRYIAMVSHEMRNSLSVVRTAARLLRLPSAATNIDTTRTLIERQVGQMTRHIDDLLELGLRGSRAYKMRRAYIDLCAVARTAIEGIAPDLARRGHRLSVNLPTKALCIYADSARLDQVLTNLLMNAAKYTPDGGDITLTIECLDGEASIRIRDSGIGIAPAMLPRVFEMFEQADTSVPNAEGGHGIGLAVVRSLVRQHGGTVRVASAGLGQGSEFTVLLPLFR